MDSLPWELKDKIVEDMSSRDLASLRLVSKVFAQIVTPLLFKVLALTGAESPRQQNVELGKLPEAIAETLFFAPYIKVLEFAPVYYQQDIWREYRYGISHNWNEPISLETWDLDPSIELDDDYEVVHEMLRNRPLKEAEKISRAEALWETKITEQESNNESILSAIGMLLQATEVLEEIRIRRPDYPSLLGDDEFPELNLVRGPRRSNPTAHFLKLLAQGLQSAGRHIRKLYLNDLVPDFLQDTLSMHHLFTQLTHFTLQLEDPEIMREGVQGSRVLFELFKATHITLQSLEITTSAFLRDALHSLMNVLGTDDYQHGGGTTYRPLVFPRLKYLSLGCMQLRTPQLLRLITAQPQIEEIKFENISLITQGQGWPFLAASLPVTVQRWTASEQLRHEPDDTYNITTEWNPIMKPLPVELGWVGTPSKTRWPGGKWSILGGVNFCRVVT